jgi:hypothetical protein
MPKDTTTKTTTTKRAAAKATARPASRAPRARRAVAAVRPARRRAASAAPITHEQIALRAYEIHLEGTDGDALAHWLRAERELVGA